MKNLPNIAGLVFNQPLLITPQYAETLSVVLSDRIGFSAEGMNINSGEADKRSESLVGKGTYVLPVVGSMSHRATGIEALSGMTSYSQLRNKLEAAYDNPDIKSILLDFDSPGGMVAGAFDLRDYIMSNRGKKPVYALSRDGMYSAAYLLGSAADKVFTTQTGGVGSIGVVAMHLDQSKKNEMAGVKPTFIYAGKYKTAGNPHEALQGEALEYMQESVNDSYDMFVKAVAEARGIDEKVVRDTQARVYKGQKGIKLGLADGINTLENLITDLSEQSPKIYSFNSKGFNMENDELKEVATKLEQATTELAAARSNNEKLTKMILDEGYKITAEGLVKEAAPEMIEVEGVLIDKATLPEPVVKALQDKAEQELKASATAMFPNLREEVSTKLYAAFAKDEDMVKTLASLNTAVGSMLAESGDTTPGAESLTAQEKLDKMVAERIAATNENKYTAYAKVAETKEGKALISELYEKE